MAKAAKQSAKSHQQIAHITHTAIRSGTRAISARAAAAIFAARWFRGGKSPGS